MSFADLASQEQHISQRILDLETQRQVVHYYLPVEKNGQISHILVGVIDCASLAEHFYSAAYDNQTTCCVVDSRDGNFIVSGEYTFWGNLYEMLPEKQLEGYEDIALKQEVKAQKTGIAAYAYNQGQEQALIYYTPLNFFDWQLLIIAPEKVVFSNLHEMKSILFAIGFAQVFLLAFYLVWNQLTLTKLQKSQKQTEEQLLVTSTLIECIHELSTNTDIHTALNNLLKIINQYFDGERTYFFSIDYELRATSRLYKYLKDDPDGTSSVRDNLAIFPFENVVAWLDDATNVGGHYISSEQIPAVVRERVFYQQNIHGLITMPIVQQGKVVGFIGIINPLAHQDNVALLSSLQVFIMATLEDNKKKQQLQNLSYADSLTGIYNQNKFIQLQEGYKNLQLKNLGIAYFDLNDLKEINDRYGHEAGDTLIKQAANNIKQLFADNCYRIGGDEFVAIAVNVSENDFQAKLADVARLMQETNIHIASGMSWRGENVSFHEQLLEADTRMYENKKQYHIKKND